jgi:hypothetical protein
MAGGIKCHPRPYALRPARLQNRGAGVVGQEFCGPLAFAKFVIFDCKHAEIVLIFWQEAAPDGESVEFPGLNLIVAAISQAGLIRPAYLPPVLRQLRQIVESMGVVVAGLCAGESGGRGEHDPSGAETFQFQWVLLLGFGLIAARIPLLPA